MGLWNWLTGAKQVDKTLDIADKTTTGIVSGIDKMFYTEEEKAEMLQKRLEIAEQASKTHIELMKVTHDETTARSVTRRIIAILIMAITVISMVLLCAIWKYDKAWGEFILRVIEYYQLGWAFIAVVVFFFGNHMIRGFKK